MTRHGSRDGTHFRKKLLNADGPVERILILLVIAVVADERRIPLRLRGPADRRESQVRADRHDEGEAGDAVRTACLPGAKRTGAVRRVAGGGA